MRDQQLHLALALTNESLKIATAIIAYFSVFFWMVGTGTLNNNYAAFGYSLYLLPKSSPELAYIGFRSVVSLIPWLWAIGIILLLVLTVPTLMKWLLNRPALKPYLFVILCLVPLFGLIYVPANIGEYASENFLESTYYEYEMLCGERAVDRCPRYVRIKDGQAKDGATTESESAGHRGLLIAASDKYALIYQGQKKKAMLLPLGEDEIKTVFQGRWNQGR